jgi:hypothetical protein
MIRCARIPRFVALVPLAALLCGLSSALEAQTAVEQPIQAFIAEAAKRLEPGDAREALTAGPAEEYYRWGQEICAELERGTDREQIVGNLNDFFGEDLSAALVGAAEKVLCP